MSKVSTPGLVGFVVASMITGLIFSILVVLVAPYLLYALLWIFGWVSASFFGSIIALTIVVAFSCGAFSLRQHHPDVYGILEIAFGAITATLALTQYAAYSSPDSNALQNASVLMPDTAKYAFAALSGLYVIVRGLDNVGKFMTSKSIAGSRAGKLWAILFVPKVDTNLVSLQRIEPSVSEAGFRKD